MSVELGWLPLPEINYFEDPSPFYIPLGVTHDGQSPLENGNSMCYVTLSENAVQGDAAARVDYWVADNTLGNSLIEYEYAGMYTMLSNHRFIGYEGITFAVDSDTWGTDLQVTLTETLCGNRHTYMLEDIPCSYATQYIPFSAFNPPVPPASYFNSLSFVVTEPGDGVFYIDSIAAAESAYVPGPAAPLMVKTTDPTNGAEIYAEYLDSIEVVFNSNMNGASVASASMISGAGVTGLTYLSNTAANHVVLGVNGTLQEGESYTVTIGSSSQTAAGTTLGSNYSFSFSTILMATEDLIYADFNGEWPDIPKRSG